MRKIPVGDLKSIKTTQNFRPVLRVNMSAHVCIATFLVDLPAAHASCPFALILSSLRNKKKFKLLSKGYVMVSLQ